VSRVVRCAVEESSIRRFGRIVGIQEVTPRIELYRITFASSDAFSATIGTAPLAGDISDIVLMGNAGH
jgi:hypothetical protein